MYAQAMIIEGVKRQLQPPPGLPSQRFPTARYVFQRLESWAASKDSPKAQPTLEAVAVSMANAIEENFAPATEPSMEISSLLWARFPAVPQALCTGCEKQRPSPPRRTRLSLQLSVLPPPPPQPELQVQGAFWARLGEGGACGWGGFLSW